MRFAVCFSALIACHVWAQSAWVITDLVVCSEARTENTASLSEEQEQGGAASSAALSPPPPPLITLPALSVSKKCISPPSIKRTTVFRGKRGGGCVTVITSIKDLRITVANERRGQCRHEHVCYYKERNYIIVRLVGINPHSWEVLNEMMVFMQ